MAERKPVKKGTQHTAKKTTSKASRGFTDEERAAMKERAQELKAAVRLVLLPRAGRGALPILPSRPTCVEGDFDTVLDEPHFRAGRFVPNYNDGDSRLLNVAPP